MIDGSGGQTSASNTLLPPGMNWDLRGTTSAGTGARIFRSEMAGPESTPGIFLPESLCVWID
jgi:hypothetical protein